MELTSREFLESKRKHADPLADNVITSLIEKNELVELKDVFHQLVYNDEIDNEKMPEEILNYFHNNSKLPDFADMKKIEIAQNAFAKFGPSIILSYFCKSLPECYACGMGAEVLGMTGRLTAHTRRRIAQTAQFVMDVMSPGGLGENGRGIASASKVRLVHASIRYYLKKSVEDGKAQYDYYKMGLPINQEDLTGTMLAFSVTVLRGIDKLGLKVSQEEKDSILHLWLVVGHLIGIEKEMMPNNYNQAEQLWDAITNHLFEKTKAGVDLNNHLIDMLEEVIPGNSMDGVVYLLMNHLLNDEAKEILEVKSNYSHSIFTFILGIILDVLLKFDSNGSFTRFFTNHVNMALMNGLKDYVAKDENIEIYVPPGLHKDWQDNNKKSNKFLGVR
jgi:hypothetical protein